MSILENFSKRVGEAAQAAAKKSGEIVEIAKLNINITGEEEKVQKVFYLMGKKVYDLYVNESDVGKDDIKDLCEQIIDYEKNISNLKNKILEFKSLKACPNCRRELEKEAVYCDRCGKKQDEEQKEGEKEEIKINCSKCNIELKSDALFCHLCGETITGNKEEI